MKQQITLTIATTDGTVTKNAINIDGLAYHRQYLGDKVFSHEHFGITHVASGRAFLPDGCYFCTQAACEQFITEVLPLADWTQDMEAINNQFGATRGQQTAIVRTLMQAYHKAKLNDKIETF